MLSSYAHAKSSISRLHVFVQYFSVSEEVRQRGSSGTGLWNSWEYEKGNQHSLWDGGVPMRQLPWGLMASFNIIINFPDKLFLSKILRKCMYSQTKGLMIHLLLLHMFSPLNCQSILSSNCHALCVCQRENTQCRSIEMELSRHERRCCVLRCSVF